MLQFVAYRMQEREFGALSNSNHRRLIEARYDSLSEIARLITGTRWSGPLFFGLNKPKATEAK